jgi:saccharopine dehydrogenase-like NADP-dependent oxidoreductase
MKKVLVLGCGMMGSIIAEDLAKDKGISVSVLDIDTNAFKRLSNKKIKKVVRTPLSYIKNESKKYDLIVGALPGNLGFKILKAVIKAGKHYCDISFMPENPLDLQKLAKKNKVTALVDCGVAPGISNMCIGDAYSGFEKAVKEAVFAVGGIPKYPQAPMFYKAPWSPLDVIDEYMRPARVLIDGKTIEKPVLSEKTMFNFFGVGELEGRLTDGLRTLLYTLDIPNMKEWTLRWQGHFDFIESLKACGFFDKENLKYTAKVLENTWKLGLNEAEFTVLQVLVDGKNGKRKEYFLYAENDDKVNSMARTTAYTCSIVAQMFLKGKIKQLGIVPPENLGMNKNLFEEILFELKKRNVGIEMNEHV